MRTAEASSPVNGVYTFLKDKAGIPVHAKMSGCMSCPDSWFHANVHEDRWRIFLETLGFFELKQNEALGPDQQPRIDYAFKIDVQLERISRTFHHISHSTNGTCLTYLPLFPINLTQR